MMLLYTTYDLEKTGLEHLAALCCEINIGSLRDLYDAFVPLVYLSSMCKNMRACEQYNREDIWGVKKS